MDEYTGFAKWGLLWVLAGVVVWSLIKVLARPVDEPFPIKTAEPDPEQNPPTAFEGLVFPGQPVVSHATDTLEATFEALNLHQPEDTRPAFYVFLTALVAEAYVTSFPGELGYDSGNLDAFWGSVLGAAEHAYETRFGSWVPEDEDDLCEDFGEAVADQGLNLDGLWFDYAAERDRGSPGAWRRMLRRNHMGEYGFEAESDAADLIAARIATLRAT